MLEWLWRLLGYDTRPDWEKNPEHYHVCPRCEKAPVNAKWGTRTVEADSGISSSNTSAVYIHYVCPSCGKVTPLGRFHRCRLDKVWDRGKL